MELVEQYQYPRRSAKSVVPVRFPWFVSISLFMVMGITTLIIVGAVARRDIANPFSAFDELNANQINLSLQEKLFTLGDLTLLWGKPEIRRYCESVIAIWPSDHRAAIVTPGSRGHLSYFSPIRTISVIQSGQPQWLRIFVNDAMHNCGAVRDPTL